MYNSTLCSTYDNIFNYHKYAKIKLHILLLSLILFCMCVHVRISVYLRDVLSTSKFRYHNSDTNRVKDRKSKNMHCIDLDY